MDNFEKMQWFW